MKKLALVLCVIFIPGISYSIDTTSSPLINSVGGTFNHGNYVTISGSGFGTKSPAKPVIWAPFEGGSAEADTSLSSGTLTTKYQIDTSNQYNSRSKYNVSNIAKTDGVKTAADLRTYINSGKFFAFARRKFPAKLFENVSNFKTFWAWPNLPGCTGNSKPMVNTIFDYMNSKMNVTYQGGAGAPGGGQILPIGPVIDDGSWVTWEIQEKKGTVDNYDGNLKWWENAKLKVNSNVLNVTSTYPTDTYCAILFQDFWTETVSGKSYLNNVKDYLDDVYMDSTWARVMIGNASTFEACTKREPLIPTAWSTTAITAYFNQGSFPNGSKVYLFVVDSNGKVSPGKAITIGGTAVEEKSGAPNPPNSLIIH
jgi:hypothetical protein